MAKWAMVLGTICMAGVLLVEGERAWAQQRPPLPPPISPPPPTARAPQETPSASIRKPISPAEVIASPEMSSYPYPMSGTPSLDVKSLVQQKAAERSASRARRLTALHWFGFSNSRPVAGVDCLHGDYSPSWTANNPHYPFRWVGVGPAWVASLPAIPSSRTGEIQK